VITITVEELEIIVSAKIEQIKPQMQKVVKEVKKAVQETEGIGAKILSKSDTERIVSEARRAGQEVKKAFDTSGIKINGQSVIRGISNAYSNLKGNTADLGNMVELSNYKNKLNEVATTAQRVKQQVESIPYIKYDQASIQNFIDNYKKGANEVKKVQDNIKKSTTHGNRLASAVQKVKNHLQGSRSGSNALSTGLSRARSMASSVTSHLKVGLGQIVKMAGALLGLRSIYNVLRNSASAWLSSQNASAQQLQANIDYMKYALGSALQPVIETIVNLIYQALKGVQSLIYALTGVNIFANASAKAYASMAKSANSASKATESLNPSDIDEVHNIQDNSDSSGSGAGGSVAPNFDLSGIETADWLQKIIDNIKNGNWYEIGATVGNKINDALNNIPWDVIKNTSGKIGKNLADFLNGGIDTVEWKLVGKTIAEGLNTAIEFAHSFVTTFNFEGFGKSIGQIVTGFFENVEWEKAGETLSAGIRGVFDTVEGITQTLDIKEVIVSVEKFVAGLDIENSSISISESMGGISANIAKGIGDYLGEKIKKIDLSEAFMGMLKSTLAITDPKTLISSWMKEHVFEPFTKSFVQNISNTGDETERTAEQKAEDIRKGIIDVLTRGWVIIVKGAESAVNKVIDFVNKAIEGINSIGDYLGFDTIDPFENVHWADDFEKQMNKINEEASSTEKTIETSLATITNNKGWNNIKTKIQGTFNQASQSKTWGSNTVTNYDSGVNSKQSALKTILDSAKTKIQSALNQSNSSSGWGSSTIAKYNNGMSGQISPLKKVIENAKNIIQNVDKSKSSYAWGYDMMTGLQKGIEARKSPLSKVVSSVASIISSKLHFSRPDEGPLRDYETWMPDMIKGLSNSLLQSAPILDNAVSEVSNSIASNLRATDLGIDVTSNVNKNINTNMSSQLENAVYSAIQKADNLFSWSITNEMKVNSKTIAKEILDDLNNEAKRRGYRPLLEH